MMVLCKQKHVGVAFIILTILINLKILQFVCISWKIKCLLSIASFEFSASFIWGLRCSGCVAVSLVKWSPWAFRSLNKKTVDSFEMSASDYPQMQGRIPT